MDRTRAFYLSFSIALVIQLLLFGVFVSMYQNNQTLINRIENRNQSILMAEDLRRSSEYLTAYCRYFVETGDEQWETNYKEVILIRDGKKKRPDGWQFSLQDSMLNLGFTDVELEKLRLAMHNSDKLAETEWKAINAVKGLFPDEKGAYTRRGTPDKKLAYELVYGPTYQKAKLSILKPIDEVIDRVIDRTHVNVTSHSSKNEWLLNITFILLLSMSIIYLLTYLHMKKSINKQIEAMQKAKQTVEKSEERLKIYHTAVEQSPAAIVITDLKGNIEYSNQQFSTITGYHPDELVGKNPRVLKSGIHPKAFYTDLWNTVLSGNAWKGELYNKRKDDTYFWEEATIAPILSADQEILKIVAIKQDVTARKTAEAALVESQQQLKELNETKNKLFSIIGHDLRGPIGTLKMVLNVLINDIEQRSLEDTRKLLESVYASTSVTFDLLENLLMWARSQQDAVSMVQTAIVIRQVVSENIALLSELAINKGQTLHNHVTEDYLAFADQNMTNTVIRNLIMNAIKFSEPTKHIHIKARVEDAFVVVMVCDEGRGIPPEDIERLFLPSYTSTGTAGEKGTGLGLLLCKDLVERQGGRLWVESEPGKGSTFSFSLPLFIST
jgi:PAS domain S-box-containing protein